MKSVVRFLSIAAVALIALGSCSKDKVDYIDPNGQQKDNVGYLSLGGMTASVMEDTDNIESSTRAGGVDINNFDVVISKGDTAVMSFKYGERPEESIALEAGVYKLTMTSAAMTQVDWESPVFGAEKEVIITRKQTTTINDIVCKMQNIKVSVGYSADIKDQLDPEHTKMTVELGQSALEFAFAEERAGFFAPLAQENTLKLTFNCRYKGETKDITMTNEIKGVKAAQWRKINVVVQHAADGTATIGIVCDTWTYDEEVTFDSSAVMMEEVIPDDSDAPVIVWEGHDLNEPFELTDDMFDADDNFKSNMSLEEDLCEPKASSTILKMMGYPTDVKGATTTRLKFAAQTGLLKAYEGTHTYEVTVVDVIGARTTVTLTIKYGQNIMPQIAWVGYDIDKRQTIGATDTCMIRVTAPLAIEDFEIEIISLTLNAQELEAVGLAAKFSLVNSTEMFTALSGLGFPVGDEVYNQTLISEDQLNISNFLGVLGMLGAGDHDFVMTVTDKEGNATTKTVMMRFE